MNAKDIIKVGAGFLAGGLYICYTVAAGCKDGRLYIQSRNINGDVKEIGKILFDPSTANKEEEAPE